MFDPSGPAVNTLIVSVPVRPTIDLVVRVKANGLEFEYDSFGDPGARPLLLIMGLGAQMISWDEEFCELLAARGFFVTRYDNRDVGLSTKLDHLGTPELSAVMARSAPPPYPRADHADDARPPIGGVRDPGAPPG